MAQQALVDWLQEAYLLAHGQIKSMERYGAAFSSYPDIGNELRQHAVETRRHLEDLEECLGSLEAKVPVVKKQPSLVTTLDQSIQAKNGTPIKTLLILYTSEQFAYSNYRALAAGARQCMADEVADICERLAEEEMAMAEWIEEQIPVIVSGTLTSRGEL